MNEDSNLPSSSAPAQAGAARPLPPLPRRRFLFAAPPPPPPPVTCTKHGIYHAGPEREGEVIVEGLTIVKQGSQGKEEGTWDAPYHTIKKAVARAGENAVIVVEAGNYKEKVELLPGQFLVSEIEGPGDDGKKVIVWEAETVPKIEAASGARAAVLMRANCTLRRFEVVAKDVPAVALDLGKDADGGEVLIRNCTLATNAKNAPVLDVRLSGRARLDGLRLVRSTLRSAGDASPGFQLTMRGRELNLDKLRTAGSYLDDPNGPVNHTGARLGTLIIERCNVKTAGNASPCLKLDLGSGAYLHEAALRTNNLAAEGAKSSALTAIAHTAAAIWSLDVSGNDAETFAGAFEVGSALKAHISRLLMERNDATTRSGAAIGVYVPGGYLTEMRFADNFLRAAGENARGLLCDQRKGTVNAFTAQGNNIAVVGRDAVGIWLAGPTLSQETSDDDALTENNSIQVDDGARKTFVLQPEREVKTAEEWEAKTAEEAEIRRHEEMSDSAADSYYWKPNWKVTDLGQAAMLYLALDARRKKTDRDESETDLRRSAMAM